MSAKPKNTVCRTALLCGERISYLYTEKAVRNLNLRLHRDGTWRLSAPFGTPTARVEAFLTSRATAILRVTERYGERIASAYRLPTMLSGGDRIRYLGNLYTISLHIGENSLQFGKDTLCISLRAIPSADRLPFQLEELLKPFFLPILERELQALAPFFSAQNVQPPTGIRLRRMKSMWGNCRPEARTLTFSTMLMAVPPACLRYVIIHEYAHLRHPNHSPAFWQMVERLCPDRKKMQEELKGYLP